MLCFFVARGSEFRRGFIPTLESFIGDLFAGLFKCGLLQFLGGWGQFEWMVAEGFLVLMEVDA